MFETIAGVLVTFAMTALWFTAGIIFAGLPHIHSHYKLRRARTLLYWLVHIALVLGMIWGLLVISLWVGNGWLFVEGIIKQILPIVLIAHAIVVIWTLPRLNNLQRLNHDLLSADARARLAHPMLALPIIAAAFASGITAFSTFLWQPTFPGFVDVLRLAALLLLALAVPSIVVVRRYQSILQEKFVTFPLWRRLLSFVVSGLLTTIVIVVFLVVNATASLHSSKLPEVSDMMNHHWLDEGGGTPTMLSGRNKHHDHANMVEVAALTGDLSAPADVRYELVAQKQEILLASGAKVETWTYNGVIAPELRARQGDMVEVKLINKDIDKGVTIHWHGYNVPNAMDGVPGMTQDAVKPGESFTYKFRANQAGTYWFHSHQQAAEQVLKGLFGTFIVEPAHEIETYDVELTLINHDWVTDQGLRTAFVNDDLMKRMRMESGKRVKLRLVNANQLSEKYMLQGTAYQITDIDGSPIQNPDLLPDRTAFRLAAGGRYDVVFTMPDRPVLFMIGDDANSDQPGVIFYTNSPPEQPDLQADSGQFDPSRYGQPAENEVTAVKTFDREFTMIIGNKMGFYDGNFTFLWTINGEVYPHTPTFVVKEGERVKTTFINKSFSEHPMHLHGHHMTVLKKNGKNVKTPWVTDTLNVNPDETYEVAFTADNPGMWMDHCHLLDHAAVGMVLHLMYDNVMPSYKVGAGTGNQPE